MSACVVVLIVLGLVWLLIHLKISRAAARTSSGGGTHDVYTIGNVLSADVFDQVKAEVQAYLRSRGSGGAHRSAWKLFACLLTAHTETYAAA